jgi:3-hydroxyisobutyrate dehydrogenase-like beta-hydroxyacid dehydrogenase
MMATGFIGLGDMGAPIAHRLLDGCIELVVFDVRAEAARSRDDRGHDGRHESHTAARAALAPTSTRLDQSRKIAI